MTTLRGLERWKERLAPASRYFVDRVVESVLPELTSAGFVVRDPTGNPGNHAANQIILQRQVGERWPTIEIWFERGGAPWLRVNFSEMPALCRRQTPAGPEEVPREAAAIVDSPAYFQLTRGQFSGSLDTEFGFNRFSMLSSPLGWARWARFALSWRQAVDDEVGQLVEAVRKLVALFDADLPQGWVDHSVGRINENVMLIHSWRLWDQRRATA